MPNRSKIIALGLEGLVLELRGQGKTLPEIVDALNIDLAARGQSRTVSHSSVKRYIADLDRATVPALHEPQVAQQNATLAIAFAEQFRDLNEKLVRWVDEADGAKLSEVRGQGASAVVIELGPDWPARTSVARELGRHLKQYTDLMEVLYNATQIQQFQQLVMDEIRHADPDVARRIEQRIRESHSIRAQAILGTA